MRKSILACTVSVLMSPMASWALGLGDIQVNSTLNQALKAEIELQSATKKDLESLHVGLAPRKAYSRSNIEFSDYLSKFRFKVIQKNGKNYISITTRKPFKEPYANFLIEASWGSGRLLREYTMLVDPPEFVKANTRAPSVATTARSSQVRRTTTSRNTGKVRRTQPQQTYTPVSGELVYGPTQKNDTLWNIAKQMAPSNVSVDQMMMALLRDNPEAFVNNNINNLKAGYVLRIKDANSLNQLDRRTARRQVQEQYQTWKEARQQNVSTVSPVDRSDRSADNKNINDGQLKLIASGDADASSAQGSLANDAKTLKEKLAMASEELESKEIENQELKARIKELEEILKTKASLVQLKDESLAALQKQKEAQEEAEETTVEVEEPQDAIVNTSGEAVTDLATESEVIEVADETSEQVIVDIDKISPATLAEMKEHIDPSVELSKAESAPVEATASEVSASAETQPTAAEEAMAIAQSEPAKEVVKSKVEDKKKAAPRKPKPAPVYEPTLEDDPVGFLLSEQNLPYTAGGGGLLVLLLAWLGLRGRGKKEAEFEESILDSQIAMDDSEFAADKIDTDDNAASTEVLASDTETSFLSDFSSDDMETLQPDDTEADPIAEADVFMVYGRYQQAEDLLKTAIDKEPERVDYQMKLLEVYHGDNQKDAFAVQADVVRDLLSKTNDDYELTSEWTRAKSWAEKLGVDIEMPDSFDGTDDASTNEEVVAESDDNVADDLESTDEFSLDDLNDDLTLDTTEIDFNDSDSVLGDLDTDGDIEGDKASTDELSLDDMELDASDTSEDSMELNLDDIENELTDESSDSDMFNLDEDTSESDTDFELEDTDTELSLEDLETDESSTENSMDLDDISDEELSIDSDELLDIDGDNSENTASDEDSFDLESTDTELSLELEDSLELGDSSLEPDEGSLELDDNLESELADDSFEMDMDKDTSDSGDDLELIDNDMDFEGLDDDFPELDAVGTKLDLAKAYIDMGDMESASSILNEVIDEGDDDQKKQAQELLEQARS